MLVGVGPARVVVVVGGGASVVVGAARAAPWESGEVLSSGSAADPQPEQTRNWPIWSRPGWA